MRAYLRMHPEWVEEKERDGYPAGAIVAFGKLLCLGAQQVAPGRFKSLAVLKAALGQYGRWVAFLISHDDVTPIDAGRFYIEGWDEWQEGDWQVRERVARIRGRKKTVTDVTPPTVTPVTPATVITPSEHQKKALSVSETRNAPSSSTAALAGAKGEPKEDADYAILAEGLSTLLGRILSADDLTEARAWIVDFAYLTAAQMLDRTGAFIEWRASQGLGQPRTVRSCRSSLTRENGYQADTGNGRKAERKGFVALAEIVRGKAPASSDGGEAGLPPTLDQDPAWQRSHDVRNPDPQPLQLAEGEVF